MRRFLLFALVAVGSILISSCLTIEQNLTLNKDGSGKKSVIMDMGAMFTNPLMAMAMASDETSKEFEKKDSTWLLVDELRDLNPQWTAEELSLLEKATGRMQIDAEKELMITVIETPFNDLAELKELEALFAAANRPAEDDEDGTGGDGGISGLTSMMGGSSNNDTDYQLGKRTLIVTSNFKETLDDLMGEGEMDGAEDMIKGMFEGAEMIYTFNLPGKVKKVKGFEGATIEGNTVTQVFDLLDFMDDSATASSQASGEIKYKR